MSSVDPVLHGRALVLRDLEATGTTGPAVVSLLEQSVTERTWWLAQWPAGAEFVVGLIAQDVQDSLLEVVGRWPQCPLCAEVTHALYVDPDIGGPDPHWVCEESGTTIAAVGSLASGWSPLPSG